MSPNEGFVGANVFPRYKKILSDIAYTESVQGPYSKNNPEQHHCDIRKIKPSISHFLAYRTY